MRSPHTEPGREVWGSGAPSLPRGGYTCVQESRPHTVRDPVAVWGRDLRIRARAWAGAARRTALLLSGQGSPASGRGLQCLTSIWPRSFVRENRGLTGGLSPLSYLGAPTSASPHTAPARGNVSRQPPASAAPRERCFRCVSRDTRPTSRKGVLGLFKASQKNRLYGVKSAPFPVLTPQTRKHPVQRLGPHTLRTKTTLFCGKLRVWGPRDTRARHAR